MHNTVIDIRKYFVTCEGNKCQEKLSTFYTNSMCAENSQKNKSRILILQNRLFNSTAKFAGSVYDCKN